MNSLTTAKYKQIPNDLEINTLRSDASRFNFARLEKINREKIRLGKFDKKMCKRKKLRLIWISCRSGRGSTHTSFTNQEKKTQQEKLTKVVLITSLTFTSKRRF